MTNLGTWHWHPDTKHLKRTKHIIIIFLLSSLLFRSFTRIYPSVIPSKRYCNFTGDFLQLYIIVSVLIRMFIIFLLFFFVFQRKLFIIVVAQKEEQKKKVSGEINEGKNNKGKCEPIVLLWLKKNHCHALKAFTTPIFFIFINMFCHLYHFFFVLCFLFFFAK